MQHLLSLSDLTPDEFMGLLDLAIRLKTELRKKGRNKPRLKGKTLGMIFQKPSLRTRVSFDMAMIQLGGQALYLSPNEISLGKRESVADVARVLSRYVDGIQARVFAHSDVVELAKYSRVPVVNGLSDYSHPCQGAADLLTIYERKGSLKGLKVAFIGDGNNVATSLAFGCALTGAQFVVASPKGYTLSAPVVARATEMGRATGSTITLVRDPVEAARDADVIYTDAWTSMGQEEETEKRLKVFAPTYQVNAELVSHAAPGYIVMHCLPAHRGQEITDDVCDDEEHSALWDQAENRMHAQKAILVELMADKKPSSKKASKAKEIKSKAKRKK
jgi:ornithine carbamoyltransferase